MDQKNAAGALPGTVQRHESDAENSNHVKQFKLRKIQFASLRLCLIVPLSIFLLSWADINRLPSCPGWYARDLLMIINLVLIILGFAAFALVIFLNFAPRSTYLLDFACFCPPEELKITNEEFIRLAAKSGNFNGESLEFQRRILQNSGIGNRSPMPRSVFLPARQITRSESREEAELVILNAVDDLFLKAQIKPDNKDIKILVVNCGVLSTTPSLSAILVNRYKLRQDIQNFNLGGMGCGAGVIAVDLANDLLEAHPAGSRALVISTEIVTSAWYAGNDLDMLASNCSFRMGAAAILLSNRLVDRWRSKYKLNKIVRTHRGMDDRSLNSAYLKEDAEGKQGLSLSQDLPEVTRAALETHIMSMLGSNNNVSKISDGKTFFRHICILAANKRVLEEVQEKLELTEDQLEASKKTLERFGNTSSSSVWYELSYLECMGRIKRGDRVWQLSFGSGFKCNSMIWKALQTIDTPDQKNPWKD